MLSNPTRHFGAGTTDTVDFGAATILANLTGLAIRVVFYLDGNVIGYVTNQTSVAAIVSTVKHLTIGGCSDATFLAPGISVREVGLWNAPLPSNLVQAMAAGNERSRMFSPSTFIGSCEMLAAGGGPEFMLSYGFGNTVPALSLSGTVTGTWVESHQQ